MATTSLEAWRYFLPEVSISHWAALMPFSFLLMPSSSPFSKGLFFKCVWCLDQTFACSSLVRLSFKVWACSSLVPPWVAAALIFSSSDILPNFSKLDLFRSFLDLALAAFSKAAFLEPVAFFFALALAFFITVFGFFTLLGFPKPMLPFFIAFMFFLGPIDPKHNLATKVASVFEPKFHWDSAKPICIETKKMVGIKNIQEKNL